MREPSFNTLDEMMEWVRERAVEKPTIFAGANLNDVEAVAAKEGVPLMEVVKKVSEELDLSYHHGYINVIFEPKN